MVFGACVSGEEYLGAVRGVEEEDLSADFAPIGGIVIDRTGVFALSQVTPASVPAGSAPRYVVFYVAP